jgi:hypothetical protein
MRPTAEPASRAYRPPQARQWRISGSATEVTVATVARLDPLIAPNPAHPPIEASASPPRRWPRNAAAALKKSRLAPAAKQIWAISKNSGRTPSSYFEIVSKATTPALITAGSGPIRTAMPDMPTNASAIPIGTPPASAVSRTSMPTIPTSSGVTRQSS